MTDLRGYRMKKLWLLFSQTATVLLAGYFVMLLPRIKNEPTGRG